MRDGCMPTGTDGSSGEEHYWLSASGIATFVYCERKYRLKQNLPAGYAEPGEVTRRKESGQLYHTRRGVALFWRLIVQGALLTASLLLIAIAVVLWFIH